MKSGRLRAARLGRIGVSAAALLTFGSVIAGCGGSSSSGSGSFPFLQSTGAWGSYRNDFQNTGRGTGVGATGHIKWTYQTQAPVFSVPVIAHDGTIYAGSIDSFLYALNPDGTVKWKFQCAGEIAGNSAAIGPDGTIYVGDSTTLYAVNPNGTLKWKFATTGFVLSSPVVTNTGVFFGSFFVQAIGTGDPSGPFDGHVYALDPATGALKWSYQTGGAVGASPTLGPDGIIYVGSYNGAMYAFNGDTGKVLWKYQTGDRIQSSASYSNGTLYFGSLDHNLYALNAADGSLKFKVTTGQRVVSSPAVGYDGSVYFGSWDGYLYNVDGQTGAIRWKFYTSANTAPGLNDESPAIGGDGTIYYETNGGGIMYALNGQTGQVKWQMPIDPINYASISVDPNGTLYVGSLDGKIIAVD